MPYLVYEENNTSKAIPIPEETAGFHIGRSMDNDVRLREDSSISRQHSLILFDSEKSEYILRDLGTNNGTHLNEYNLSNQQCPLRDGDTIGIGSQIFTFYSKAETPYELVDTTTIYIHKPVPDMSPPNEYPFKDTTKLSSAIPGVIHKTPGEEDIFPEIKGFEFIRIIGGGNYTTTYRVFQTSLKRTVVLKTFHT